MERQTGLCCLFLDLDNRPFSRKGTLYPYKIVTDLNFSYKGPLRKPQRV